MPRLYGQPDPLYYLLSGGTRHQETARTEAHLRSGHVSHHRHLHWHTIRPLQDGMIAHAVAHLVTAKVLRRYPLSLLIP